MQTSLARRERQRRNGTGPGASRGGAASRFALVLPLLLLGSMVLASAVTFVAAVDIYATYSRDLEDPRDLLKDVDFNQKTVLLDRTGTVQLATYGSENRRVLKYSEIPAVVVDATTSAEDKTFWTQHRLRSGGGPVCLPRRAVRPPAWRLNDHPAARSPAPPAPDQQHLRPQDQGDHPVGAADSGVPRSRGQADHHHDVSEPQLLRQPELRHRCGCRGLLRHHGPQQADDRPVRHSGRAAAGTVLLRPRAERRRAAERIAGRSGRLAYRGSAELHHR